MRSLGALLRGVAAGCASPRTGVAPVRPAALTPARDSLVVYPESSDVIQAHDSSLLFGAVRGGKGPARLTVDGRAAPVLATGAWIAWVRLPDDTLARFRLVARAGADSAVTLLPYFAELHDADVLVPIHAHALSDGVNPFTNNGTSVYYFQPRSTALARELDRALVAELGVRDLGMERGDYAPVRPTWMPSALTEALFIMMPEQEALLASEDRQWRYATGVLRGIEAFLREHAREP